MVCSSLECYTAFLFCCCSVVRWCIAVIPYIYMTGTDLSLPLKSLVHCSESGVQWSGGTLLCIEMHSQSVSQRWVFIRRRGGACVRPPASLSTSYRLVSLTRRGESEQRLVLKYSMKRYTSQFPVFSVRAQGCNITLRSIYNICVGVSCQYRVRLKWRVGHFCHQLTLDSFAMLFIIIIFF